ncbi:MAG TPA: PAS domain S-box protein, partial [Anaerolineales bacterium]
DALRQSEERYRAVVESQAEMLCRFRPDGTILFVNEAYARARGTTAEELIRDNFWTFITEEDRPGVRAMLERLTPEELEARMENRFQTVDGERWTLWTNRALRFDESGRLLEVQSTGIDITDRKRVEESLQLSEQKFSSIFHAAPFAIALQKLPDSRFADVNDAFVQLFGYEREELIGRTSLDVGIQPDEAMRSRVIQQFEGQGFMRNAELQVKTKFGQMIWVSVSAEIVKIAGEDHILALAMDITARKQAEQDLRESEERYRFIVENTSDGIWWIELAEPMPVTLSEDEQVDWYYNHAVIRQCNLGLARMYGYSSVNEVLGLPLRVVMPRENPANLEMLRQFIRSGYRLVDTESRELASNGRELVFINNMIGIVEDGMLKGEWGTNRDITERKRAEEALRESEERYRGIINQTIAGIAETDLTGRFSMVNERYCEITGYRRSELLNNMGMEDVTHPDDLQKNLEQFERLAADGTSFEIEKRYIRPDGSIVWVHNSVSAIVGAEGQPQSAVAAVIDVTERKRAEETLRRNEELFSTLVEAAPFGVYFIDSEFRLRAINKGSEAVFSGIYPLIGRDFAEILRIVWQEPFATETIERFRHTLRTGEPFISPPTIQPRANIDEIQSYDWQIHRITMPDGRYGVVCYYYDLS